MLRSKSDGRWDGPDATLWSLDLETTGLDPRHHEVLEIGLVPIRQRTIEFGQAWSTFVVPEIHGSETIPVHGLMPVDLVDAVPPATAVAELLARFGGNDALLVHYAKLDIGFLRSLFLRVGRTWPSLPVIDTAALLQQRNARLRQLGEAELPLQLGEARAALGLPAYSQHRAVSDAVAAAEVWLAMTSRW